MRLFLWSDFSFFVICRSWSKDLQQVPEELGVERRHEKAVLVLKNERYGRRRVVAVQWKRLLA